ncbi:unnamed protein product [Allacma fusca]|uniref:Uncharacterized protein n=1 Tax=Allacma fusca TaxID=39272 RepID=A0A8J2LWI4_9HEXA|nr:unnamed protein product [Allacma fusca]
MNYPNTPFSLNLAQIGMKVSGKIRRCPNHLTAVTLWTELDDVYGTPAWRHSKKSKYGQIRRKILHNNIK